MIVRHIDIIPGIGPQENFSVVKKRVTQVAPFVDWIHIDIADGKLVPNKTLLDPAPFKGLIQETKKDFELHMMVDSPFTSARKWVEAGFGRLIMHIESVSNTGTIRDTMHTMKNTYKDLQIGLAIDRDTPVESVFPFLAAIDTILVMTIKAGFSGQKFIPELLEKVKVLRAKKYYLPITVDGGINDETSMQVIEAGASRLVSTSYIFKAKDTKEAIEMLKRRPPLE